MENASGTSKNTTRLYIVCCSRSHLPATPFTGSSGYQLHRSQSQETLATSPSQFSAPSIDYPRPPANTPAAHSVIENHESTESVTDLTNRLQAMTAPSKTESTETEGKTPSRIRVNSSMDLSKALFKSPPKQRKISRDELLSKYASAGPTPPTRLNQVATAPPTFEHSMWAVVAEEDVALALKRMAQSARDEHQKDPSKSVEQYYSERLARLIGVAEVEFDASYLRKS